MSLKADKSVDLGAVRPAKGGDFRREGHRDEPQEQLPQQRKKHRWVNIRCGNGRLAASAIFSLSPAYPLTR
jgi:hypothetical protein